MVKAEHIAIGAGVLVLVGAGAYFLLAKEPPIPPGAEPSAEISSINILVE